MTSQSHERIVGQGDDAIKIVVEGIGGTPNEEDVEFLRMSGAIFENFVQVLSILTKQGGNVGLFANRAKELIKDEKCLVWVGEV